jgi:hypothetical protein
MKKVTMNVTLRSAAALLAGLVAIFTLSIGTDVLLEKGGYLTIARFGENAAWVLALVLFCRVVYFVLGGFLAAKLAPNHPMRHALIIGCVGVVLNVVGAVMTWEATPHWFSITLILLAFACSWFGGRLGSAERKDAFISAKSKNID